MSAEPEHVDHKHKLPKANPSGAAANTEDETATAILKKKKKPNALM
jgi:transitional endoplasmic reticulum ATPase